MIFETSIREIPEPSPFNLKNLEGIAEKTFDLGEEEDLLQILETLKNLPAETETPKGELTLAEKTEILLKVSGDMGKFIAECKRQEKDRFDTSKHEILLKTFCAENLIESFQQKIWQIFEDAGIEDLLDAEVKLKKGKKGSRSTTGGTESESSKEKREYFNSITNPENLEPGSTLNLRGMGKLLDPSQIAKCNRVITFGANGKSLGWKLDKEGSTPYDLLTTLASKEIFEPACAKGILQNTSGGMNPAGYFTGKVIPPPAKVEVITLEIPSPEFATVAEVATVAKPEPKKHSVLSGKK